MGLVAYILRPRNLVIACILLVVLGAGYRFWLRDSSLVAVTGVTVKGAEGPEAAKVKAALESSGVGMSTLSVDESTLEESVAGFATVAGIHADADFPHGLTVTVDSRPPALLVEAGGETVPAAGDGTILSGVDTSSEKLPKIKIDELPQGKTLTGDAFGQAVLTGAAPAPLHKLIDKIKVKSDQGVVITIAGLPVIFGTSDRAAEKWIAVAATLSDPKLDSLSYLDVRVPERPAAGGAGESLADAPDLATVVPTDVVPVTTEETAPVEAAAPVVSETDPAVIDPALAPVESSTAPTTDMAVPPATTETPTTDSGAISSAGGVTP